MGSSSKNQFLLGGNSIPLLGLNSLKHSMLHTVQSKLEKKKAREFANLKQESLIVWEFEQKFIQLERLAPGICAMEKPVTSKFVWGLRLALKEKVARHKLGTLAEAVAIGFVFEEVLADQYGAYNKKEKNKSEGANSKSEQSYNK